MAREVVWSETALDDLDAIAGYIARDSEHYAAALVREALDAADSLSTYADRGQIVPETRDERIRELLIRPYRLVYRIEDQVVLVLAVIHGAQRMQR